MSREADYTGVGLEDSFYCIQQNYAFTSHYQIHAVYMKVEVKRRNDLPAITGKLESYTVNAQYQSKSVQTTIGGEDLVRYT